MEQIDFAAVPSTNGAAKTKKTRPKPSPCPRTPRAKPQQKLALAVGGVGCFVLLLSVWECCAALHSLTGLPWALAAFLALGIDAGMVTAEMAAVACDGASEAHLWSERYIRLAVVLSVLLNAVAAAAHAEGLWKVAAVVVGGLVPVLVYIAGRVSGSLYTGR
jgi:hypothetical protein